MAADAALESSKIVPVLTVFIPVFSGIFGYFALRWKEDATKRLELTRIYTAKQIEEFYAPLVALTDQLDVSANVFDFITADDPRDKDQIADLVYKDNFEPAHEEIAQILKTRIHLAEGRNIPPSFIAYLNHYRAQRVATQLKRAGLKVQIKDPGFPPEFYHDVRKGLDIVSARYEDTVTTLRYKIWLTKSKTRKLT